AKGILLNVTGSSDLGLFEINEAAAIITEAADPDANIIFGAVIDDKQGDEIRITVIATGFNQRKSRMGLEELEIRSLVDGEELEIPSFLWKREKKGQ
ncbi:MAG TPA: cell division protein FtsZ, partial [Firmicutes bacterium]|nr:cell division protein FtsZ [Bacillota bacterium]